MSNIYIPIIIGLLNICFLFFLSTKHNSSENFTTFLKLIDCTYLLYFYTLSTTI